MYTITDDTYKLVQAKLFKSSSYINFTLNSNKFFVQQKRLHSRVVRIEYL